MLKVKLHPKCQRCSAASLVTKDYFGGNPLKEEDYHWQCLAMSEVNCLGFQPMNYYGSEKVHPVRGRGRRIATLYRMAEKSLDEYHDSWQEGDER